MDESETLLGFSSVYLFGRKLSDIKIITKHDRMGIPETGNNNFLREQLRQKDVGTKEKPQYVDVWLAKIFAFSYEGAFQELYRPAIFLVHGEGLSPDDPAPSNVDGETEYARLARSPGASSLSGLGHQTGALAKDMKVWVYDKGDFSMRLDVDTGTLDDILLYAELDHDYGDGRSGSGRSGSGRSGSGRSGSGRSGSVMARSSGWMPRK